MQVAESKGLPQLKYHLLPRTKGFTTTMQCLKGTGTDTQTWAHSAWVPTFNEVLFCFTVKAVYDVTLNFQDNQTPTLLGIVNGKKYKADMSVRSVVVL